MNTESLKPILPADRFFLLILSLLLFLPHYFAAPWVRTNWHLGLPRVITGDEPHYLLLINSLLEDGDLDMKNNYASSRAGSLQAGEYWSGKNLDHHTVWYDGDRRVEWWRIGGAEAEKSDHPEYSMHGPGLALFFYPLLYPFKGTSYVEFLSVYLSGIFTVLAMLIFWYWVRGYVESSFYVNLITLLTFLGTPIWHYGRTLYTEPYLLFFGVAAYCFALKKSNAWVPGLCIALGMLMKPPFVLLLFPLLGRFLFSRKFKAGLSLLVFPVVSLVLIFVLNQIMFGSLLRSFNQWESRPFWEGLQWTFFNSEHGLLLYAPAVIVAMLGWSRFFRDCFSDAATVFSGFFLYFILMVLWRYGGYYYGSRMILPIIPFLMLGMVKIPDLRIYQNLWVKFSFAFVSCASLLINFLGAIPCWRFIGKHPFL
jgi:hypothetical protein